MTYSQPNIRVIDIVPVSKPRMTRRDKWMQRPVVVAYRNYGDELRLKLPRYKVPSKLWIEFYLPMPKSWSKKRKSEMNDTPHQQKPDIDNLVKAFLDHLCEDDAYVYNIKAAKFWSDRPRIMILDGVD